MNPTVPSQRQLRSSDRSDRQTAARETIHTDWSDPTFGLRFSISVKKIASRGVTLEIKEVNSSIGTYHRLRLDPIIWRPHYLDRPRPNVSHDQKTQSD
jgi:hypothetical protein